MVEVGCVDTEARARAGKSEELSTTRRAFRKVASTTIGARPLASLRCPGDGGGKLVEHPRVFRSTIISSAPVSGHSRSRAEGLALLSTPLSSLRFGRERGERDGARGGRRCHRIRGPLRGPRPGSGREEVRQGVPLPVPKPVRGGASDRHQRRHLQAGGALAIPIDAVSTPPPGDLAVARRNRAEPANNARRARRLSIQHSSPSSPLRR